MTSTFPPKAVEYISRYMIPWIQEQPRAPVMLARSITKSFSERSYGFKDSMRTGNYAPYVHERDREGVGGYNCTTVIPDLFIYAQLCGLNPCIVQFLDFRDVQTTEDKKNPTHESHFAVTSTMHGRKYVFDPFWSICGPVLEEQEHAWRIGKNGSFKRTTREFGKVLHYSESDFVQLMDHLRTPAGSLDMLVAGQKIFDGEEILRAPSELMVYHDGDHTITTRLSIPQYPVSEKVLSYHLTVDGDGEVTKRDLELFLAKKTSWNGLIEGKRIARTTFSDMYALRRIMQEGGQWNRHSRVGPALADKQRRQEVFDITDRLYADLTDEERTAIQKRIAARTFYEGTHPEKEYLFSSEEHDQQIIQWREEELALRTTEQPVLDDMWLVGWKLKKVPQNEYRRLLRLRRRMVRKHEKLSEKINYLNSFRQRDPKAYHRTMDKLLFAKPLEEKSAEEIVAMMNAHYCNLRWGYAAMVIDFLPYVIAGRKHLELRNFWGPLQGKLKARLHE